MKKTKKVINKQFPSPRSSSQLQSNSGRLISPDKKSKQLSELTPVQFFQKKFGELEAHFYELKKYNPPNGSDSFFQTFVDFKSQIPSFSVHASKILKQRALCSPLNLQSFNACISFREQLPLFIEEIYKYSRQIKELYQQSIFNYFSIMITNFNDFASYCYRDPHTRSIINQYQEKCRVSLRKIQSTLQEFFEPHHFLAVTKNTALEISENIKTLGRFFMNDLQRILAPYLNQSHQIKRFYFQFRDAFMEIVPMLSAIPCFRDEFAILLTKIEPVKDALKSLFKFIGEKPEKMKIAKKPSLTGTPVELVEEVIDPLIDPINILSESLQIKFNDEQTNAEKIQIAAKTAQKTINVLKSELEKAQRKLKLLEPLDSKETIIDRFDQIRNFKNEYTKQEEKIRNDFMRNLIYQIKTITNDNEINLKDNFNTQVRKAIDDLKEMMNQKNSEINSLQSQIIHTKSELYNICKMLKSNSELNENQKDSQEQDELSLDQLLLDLFNLTKASQNSLNDNNEKIRKFIKENLPHNSNLSISMSFSDILECFQNEIENNKKEITNLKSQISKLTQSKVAFKDETVKVLGTTFQTLAKIYSGNEKITPPTKLTELRDQTLNLLKKVDTKHSEQNQRLLNFFIQIMTALKLPQIDFSDDQEDAIQKAMDMISDSLTIPTKSQLIINSTSLEEHEKFKTFLLDIFTQLTQKPKEEIESGTIDEIKPIILSNIQNLTSYKVNVKEFNEFLPLHSESETFILIKKQLRLAQLIDKLSVELKNMKADVDFKDFRSVMMSFIDNNDDINPDILGGLKRIISIMDAFQKQ